MPGCPARRLLALLPVALVLALTPAAAAFHRRPLQLRSSAARTPTAAFGWSKRRATATASDWSPVSPSGSSASAAAVSIGEGASAPAPSSRFSMARQLSKVSGGAAAASSSSSSSGGFSFSAMWGVLGVVAVLGNAIRRLLPIALEPFGKAAGAAGAFTPALWAQYAGFALFMAYAEGYKGFQLKFSPLVVKRAYTLGPHSPLLHKLFAAPYAMGLFHASKKRKVVSWSLALGIVGLVKLVKGLAYPYRSIVDAGVVVGLSYGALSILGIYLKALVRGSMPEIDPALPEAKTK